MSNRFMGKPSMAEEEHVVMMIKVKFSLCHDGIRTHNFQTTVRRSIAIVFVPDSEQLLTIGRIESGLGPRHFTW